MPSSITKISTTTLTSTTASITLSSIPATYTDLLIKLSTRTSRAAGNEDIYLEFNGSGGTAYLARRLYGTSALGSDSSSSVAAIEFYSTSGNTATASSFGSAEIYIPNYASANNKVVSVDAATANNSSAQVKGFALGIWSNSAAITSIKLTPVQGGSFLADSTATLYGVTKYAETGTGSKAVGGTVTTSGGYTYHTFFSSGMFTPTTSITGAEFLVVAGGGGVSGSVDGGGGAGGVVYASSQSYSSGVGYAAVVGAGGAGGSPGTKKGSNGNDSYFASGTVAVGGGHGGSSLGSGNGGSGGGEGAPGTGNVGTGTAGQGNSGGAKGSAYGGGGGGAGAAGAQGGTNGRGGDGGIGVSTYSAWGAATGTGENSGGTYYYAGGGGGAAWNGVSANGIGGHGGLGGGGQGAGSNTPGTPVPYATNGMPNTGGGAGGDNGYVYSGGSGIVIVRYTT